MSYQMKPLRCDPAKLKGLSERLIVSHYENNYGGAVKRLNAITDELKQMDYSATSVFRINGLKREELVAMNSMILHELYFDGLGEAERPAQLTDALARAFGSAESWHAQFAAMGKAQGGGSGWVLLTYSPRDRIASLSSLSTCTSIPITLTMARRLPPTSMRFCRTSTGRMSPVTTRAPYRPKGANASYEIERFIP
jgi:superoxide dismutase